MKKRVNLFLVGAMKSGTTTLHEYLSQHPDIFMSEEKEPGYFVPERWGDRPKEDYDRLFTNAYDKKYVGESSTDYTKLPTYQGVAERIYQYNSDAKIIYIMRHPIERTISHYFYSDRDLGFFGETHSIIKAIEKEPEYTAYSNYAMQIRPYFCLFGRQNVYTLTLEELINNPQTCLKSLFDWLEVAGSVQISGEIKTNVKPQAYNRASGFGLMNRFRHTEFWDKLSKFMPKIIRTVGVKISTETVQGKLDKDQKTAVYNMLTPIVKKYLKDLVSLTEKDYSCWKI